MGQFAKPLKKMGNRIREFQNNPFMRDQINSLYDEGHFIMFQTARGKSSGINWTDLTKKQLYSWGLKYHELFDMFCKPNVDIFIDDKGINVEEWKNRPSVKGIVAGAFDLIHPGYIKMFREAKNHCNHLTIALHKDPSTERITKLKPVQNIEERKEILDSIKYVDDIVEYDEEIKFIEMLPNYDVRFLGNDYKSETIQAKMYPSKAVG